MTHLAIFKGTSHYAARKDAPSGIEDLLNTWFTVAGIKTPIQYMVFDPSKNDSSTPILRARKGKYGPVSVGYTVKPLTGGNDNCHDITLVLGAGKEREQRVQALAEAVPIINTGICFDRSRQTALLREIQARLEGACICNAHLGRHGFEVAARGGGKVTFYAAQILRLCLWWTECGQLECLGEDMFRLSADTLIVSPTPTEEPSSPSPDEHIPGLIRRYERVHADTLKAETYAHETREEFERRSTTVGHAARKVKQLTEELAAAQMQLRDVERLETVASTASRQAATEYNRLQSVERALLSQLMTAATSPAEPVDDSLEAIRHVALELGTDPAHLLKALKVLMELQKKHT